MKKYIKQIATLALIVAFASCSADDDVEMVTSVGGNVAPQTTSISRLDNNYNLPLKVYSKEGVTATKVEIYLNTAGSGELFKLGAKVSDGTITGSDVTFNTSTLGSFDTFPTTATPSTLTGKTGSFSLLILSTYSDGTTTTQPYTLTVAKGIVWKQYNEDGSTSTTSGSGVSSVLYNDHTSKAIIKYAVVNKSTTVITSVVGEWAKNNSTVFAPLPGTFAKTTQDIDVAAIPYSTYGGLVAGDAITYRFTVTAGTQTDVISTKITFANQEFDADKSGSISNDPNSSKFSFLTGLSYDNTKDAEIAFVVPFGIKVDGTTPLTLVASTLNYDTADLFMANTAYNAGAKVTQLTSLSTGDVVLYKVTRKVDFGTADEPDIQDVDYYGILKVTDKVSGDTSQKLIFSYKEGVLRTN
ncbi:hypothetical protein OIU83_06845 [Flavobacterium sp. LS1R49]|uniref:DUF5017 domain-containing protein n=1 Tax=Flavobacterium shii TaxID=2987687 RepID=A0A9X2ZAB1_9FLAO|nr:hypothetical protein [Flavobacterium shii]MCV9927361.1 hypothetical protein [Flavobacterium shii]